MADWAQALFHWASVLDHNSKSEKDRVRYQVGLERLPKLRERCLPLFENAEWVQNENESTLYFSFFAEVDDDFRDLRMPESTTIEYVALKKIGPEKFSAFADLCLETLDEPKVYNMTTI